MTAKLISELGDSRIDGLAMANVSVLRLDLVDGLAPGNKSFKLRENLELARQQGVSRLVSFGGAWSNHLHALAAVGRQSGLDTVGIVRGDEAVEDTAMLQDARAWGMQIVRVSRDEYRRRNDAAYLEQIRVRFAPCVVIPEGGGNCEGARGAIAIAELARELAPDTRRLMVPVGTGTTLAGLVAGLDPEYEVIGISALKNASDLESRVDSALTALGATNTARWHILHQYHCGGFARTSAPLRKFMVEFEQVHGIPLEPVYTGKTLFALQQLLQSGQCSPGEPLLLIHTGGLQGRRGYPWLNPGARQTGS